jgi:hypothetical protein
MHQVLLYCAECGQERAFEEPPCVDGHGDDCPERACVECGFAVLVGIIPPVTAVSSRAPAGARGYQLASRRVA